MNDFLRAVVGLVLGGLLVGFGSVFTCQLMNPTPKFCGLMVIYTTPVGAVLGFIVGLFSSLGRKP